MKTLSRPILITMLVVAILFFLGNAFMLVAIDNNTPEIIASAIGLAGGGMAILACIVQIKWPRPTLHD